jgi:hypothetical protein
MAEVRVVLNQGAIAMLGDPNRNAYLARAMAATAGRITNSMKRLAPVSPVYPVSGATVPGGRRYGGDFPLRPSGYMRSSIRAYRMPDGSIIIGPSADYSAYVNDGTRPHTITSHGPWPLRNRATGRVFGPLVHHPGTRAVRFVERSIEGLGTEVFRA